MKELIKTRQGHPFHPIMLTRGGSLVWLPSLTSGSQARVGLSVPSPRFNAQPNAHLRAFHFYPCRGFIIFLCLFISCQLQSQVVTLDSVVRAIEKNNPMLQEYDQKINALNTYAEGARSWMAPMVGAGTLMTPYPNQMLMEDRDKGSWMFSVEQEIPNPSKLNANKRYLSSKAAVEDENRSVQFNELRSEAKATYYRWYVAEQKAKILKENEQLIELMLKLARIRYPYNQGSLGNIYKTEGRLSEIQNMIETTMGDIEQSSFRLKALMNVPHNAKIMIDTAIKIDFEASQLYDTSTLAERRSDIQRIDRTIEVMYLNQQLQRYQARPDFKIRFDHMQPVGDMPSQFTAMAMISIPIAPWSSKMYKSEVKGMQYDIQAMRKNREALLNETRGMIAGMVAQLTRMKHQLSNYENRIIPALQKNYQTVMIAYEENREQLPMVIDAWEALNMAQMEYLEKKEQYVMMIVAYEKTLEK